MCQNQNLVMRHISTKKKKTFESFSKRGAILGGKVFLNSFLLKEKTYNYYEISKVLVGGV